MSNTINIDGTEYVRADSFKTPDYSGSPVRIVIAQCGWVFVGRWEEDGERVTLHNARVIRRWGTTKGLGELCVGPTSSTVFDPAGTVELHVLGVVASLACDEAGWDL